jgi:hypothetical protein
MPWIVCLEALYGEVHNEDNAKILLPASLPSGDQYPIF